MIRLGFLAIAFSTFVTHTFAAGYVCVVTRKYDSGNEYTQEQISRQRFSNLIEETSGGVFVSRCSVPPAGDQSSCDRYRIDRVVFDEVAGHRKYYHFRSQFDVQIFRDLTYIENNGRGGISHGQCKLRD